MRAWAKLCALMSPKSIHAALLSVSIALGLMPAACGDDRGGTSSRLAFASCETDDDCDEGLFCAQGGIIAKHCARECKTDQECVTRLGEGHECVDAVCVQICGGNPECSDPPTEFVKCGAGLGCRGLDDTAFDMYCSYLCADESWGDGTREAQ
ncbi:MAG: hypothetical protein QM778_19655 [Myxococcales bacterium]